jgi:hypothetical protein
MNPFRRSTRNPRPTPWQPIILALVIAVSFGCGVALAFFEHALKTSAADGASGGDGVGSRRGRVGSLSASGSECWTLSAGAGAAGKERQRIVDYLILFDGHVAIAESVIRLEMAHQHG